MMTRRRRRRKKKKSKKKKKKEEGGGGKGAGGGKEVGEAGGEGDWKGGDMKKKPSRFIGTLIPKKDAEAHMARRAHAVKDSFKLDEADFKAAIKQIICSNVIYLIASFLFIGFGGFVMTGAGSQTFIGVIQAAVGTIYFVLAFIALIGAKFESDRILLTYYSLQVFVMFFTLGVAGFTLVLTDQAANLVEQNTLQTPLEGSELSDQLQAATTKALSLRVFLYLCGGIGMALVPLQAYTLSVASSIVTELRAITILMETLTLTMFPWLHHDRGWHMDGTGLPAGATGSYGLISLRHGCHHCRSVNDGILWRGNPF